MKFNKTMVDVINEIRRLQVSSEETPVKLTAPDIGDILVKIYQGSNDVHTKALITIFMREAGETWIDRLEDNTRRSAVKDNIANLTAKVPTMLSMIKSKTVSKAISS